MVLLSEVARAQDAASSADKILAEMRAPHSIEHRELYVSMSVGIGLYPDDGQDAETLLKSADAALYRAKAHARRETPLFEADMAERPQRATHAGADHRGRAAS